MINNAEETKARMENDSKNIHEIKVDIAVVKSELKFLKETIVQHTNDSKIFMRQSDDKYALKRNFDSHVFQMKITNGLYATILIGIFVKMFLK